MSTTTASNHRACPCLHTTPCHPRCTCVMPQSSLGCRRCCSYGNTEQQRQMAEYLAGRPPAGVAVSEPAANVATDQWTFYGPHPCEVCGVTIVKAARKHGGAEFYYPAEGPIYPNTRWWPHVHAVTSSGPSQYLGPPETEREP